MPKRNKSTFTKMELAFVFHWAGDQVAAARAAGYQSPEQMASRLMKRKHVKAAIDKKITEATKDSAKRTIRKITFGRNDIIMALGDLAGLGTKEKAAESESARASCLRTLADCFDLIPKAGDKSSAGMFKDWSAEELDDFRLAGRLPARFGIQTEDYNELTGNTTGFCTSAAVPLPARPTMGAGSSDGGTPPTPAPSRK
jgi:hypothetical protein